jgi:hypothetical protein
METATETRCPQYKDGGAGRTANSIFQDDGKLFLKIFSKFRDFGRWRC